MVNRSKAVGTAGESLVVAHLRANGFGAAERRALHGGKDLGDITGIPGLVIEVKAGDAARNASDGQIDLWLVKTETKRANAGADLGLLVVARARKNVRSWWCCMTTSTYELLRTGKNVRDPLAQAQCRVTLQTAVLMLRARGWGDAL